LHLSDGEFEVTDDAVVTVTPVPNLPPTANAGPDQTVLPRLDRTGLVQLDGRGSSDPNSDPLTYTWTWTDIVTGQPEVEHGARPYVILPIGVSVIHLVVNDGQVTSTNDAFVQVTVSPLHARVPTHFTSVQAAIDYCQDGDTVVLERGIHTGSINFKGKAISVEGEVGWEDTTLLILGGGTGVTFASGEGPDSRLRNVTIKGGLNLGGGAGIRIENASPTIVSCRLTQNSQGGAVYITGASAAPRLCTLLIHGNMASTDATAVWVTDGARPVVTNCNINGNTSGGTTSCAVLLQGGCQAQFRDCLIWNNTPHNVRDDFTASTFTCCDVGPAFEPLPGAGNIAQAPLLIGGSLSNFYLKQVAAGQTITSKCVDAGSTTVEAWVAEMGAYGADIAAEIAKANTRNDGVADTGVVDIGFHHHPEPVHVNRI
jgi:hypothetical protein